MNLTGPTWFGTHKTTMITQKMTTLVKLFVGQSSVPMAKPFVKVASKLGIRKGIVSGWINLYIKKGPAFAGPFFLQTSSGMCILTI